MTALPDIPPGIAPDRPVLIAGPTASGKSALALALAERDGGRIINADALQVFANWRILTARPSPDEEARAPHALYGHVPGDTAYSVGHWLRDLAPLLEAGTLHYLGVLGPTARRERLREMAEAPEVLIHGPVGLDIGAELPESIALAIASGVVFGGVFEEGLQLV